MLEKILDILCITGISLSVLLGIVILLLLLILFFPFVYDISGQKEAKKITLSVKCNWLFGLVRIRYCYPNPGYIKVTLLGFVLYDSKRKQTQNSESVSMDEASEETEANNTNIVAKEDNNVEPAKNDGITTRRNTQKVHSQTKQVKKENKCCRFGSKIKKIKYTIREICDKIKAIFRNLCFYKELLSDQNTLQLMSRLSDHIKRIWFHIHPRRVDANIIFGIGSPDTTGYIMGLYGVLSPHLGRKCVVTPDFEQAVFQGNAKMKGYIQIFPLLLHAFQVYKDPYGRQLLSRIKEHGNSTGNTGNQ